MNVKELKELLKDYDDDTEICEMRKSFGRWTLGEITIYGHDPSKKFLWFDGSNPSIIIGTVNRDTLEVTKERTKGALYIGDLIK